MRLSNSMGDRQSADAAAGVVVVVVPALTHEWLKLAYNANRQAFLRALLIACRNQRTDQR